MWFAIGPPPWVAAGLQFQIVELGDLLGLDAEVVERLFLRRMAVGFHQERLFTCLFLILPTHYPEMTSLIQLIRPQQYQ